jgi:hypothetical protein
MRRRGFESHPVLSVFDNSVLVTCAHVVVVAYCPAKAEARVRLPLGTCSSRDVGKPGSIRLLREQEIAGSNPAIPTLIGQKAFGRRPTQNALAPGT